MPASFDDIEIGQVVSLGDIAVDPAALEAFIAAFAPGWPTERGAPDAMVYALWCRLDAASVLEWPQTKRLGVDAHADAPHVMGGMSGDHGGHHDRRNQPMVDDLIDLH